MDFWQVLKSRKSIRHFKPDVKISESAIKKIIEAGIN